MAIWKPTVSRKGKSGRTRSKFYWGSYTSPGAMKPVRVALKTADRSAAEIKLADIERRAAMAHAGIVNPHEAHHKRPLTEHVDDWHASLLAKGNTRQHADDSKAKVSRVIEECKFSHWADISASKVQTWLGDVRKPKKEQGPDGEKVLPGLSAATANYYLLAFKGFCNWAVKDQRAAESPLSHLGKFNERIDRRHDRRAFEEAELRTLLESTAAAPTRCGMTGKQRTMLYKLASLSGLRARELRTLTPKSFNLDGDRPKVTVAAAYSKHRREDEQPLPASIVPELRSYLDKLPKAGPVFRMPHPCNVVRVLREDLATARAAWIKNAANTKERKSRTESAFLEYRDDAGRVLDFHAFRHTFISSLTAGGVHPKDAQILARHGSIQLTMDRYTHRLQEDTARGLDALPDLSSRKDGPEQLKATGTYGPAPQNGSKKIKTKSSANTGQKGGLKGSSDHMGGDGRMSGKRLQNKGFSAENTALGRGGVEPPTHGFSVRVRDSITSCNSNNLQEDADSCCTKSSADSGESHPENLQRDAELDALIASLKAAWPKWNDRTKGRIIGLVEGATA